MPSSRDADTGSAPAELFATRARRDRKRYRRPRGAFFVLFLAAACIDCARSRDRAAASAGESAGVAANEPGFASHAGKVASWRPAVDPRAFGRADLASIGAAAFSQVEVSGHDPQVLDLRPDLVPRGWSQWHTAGLRAGDYAFAYPRTCQARGTKFVGGLTASVIFRDEMSRAEFNDEVGRDAAGRPVPHGEIVPGAYRATPASSAFRRRLVEIAKTQIDGGVDGLFFDEVNSSYIGASYQGNEGFDDHGIADFGRFVCAKYAFDRPALAAFDLIAADHLDCASPDGGASFDYRGYLGRHSATSAPLGAANPLRGEWGTTVPNRPDPSVNSFVETYPALVYWQDVVVAVRRYARERYGKEILVTANGVLPFVDFQSVGLYDWNHDGDGPRGFDYLPLTGTGASAHFDGRRSFLPVFASLQSRSDRVTAMTGGKPVPLLLFLDWPTDTIDRYYALPRSERQDYVRIVLAEAHALGEWFALPLATTTDANTATALGMMDFFKSMRAFYGAHADVFRRAKGGATTVAVSAPGLTTHVSTLPGRGTVVHLINHNYAAGFVPQSRVVVTLPVVQSPASATVLSPDEPAERPATFRYASGEVSVTVGTVVSSVAVVLK